MSDNLEKIRQMTKVLIERDEEIIRLKKIIDSSTVWNQIYDKIPVPMCLATGDTFFSMINDKFCEVLGYTKEELLKTTYIDLIHPDDVEATYTEIGKLIATKSSVGFSNRYRCKNGEYIRLEWNSAVYSDNNIIAIAMPK